MDLQELRITWTIVAIIGAVATAWLLREGTLMMIRVERGSELRLAVPLGARWWTAAEELGLAIGLLTIWVGFAVVGVIEMNLPAPPPPANEESRYTTTYIVLAMEFVLGSVVIWKVFARMMQRRRQVLRRTVAVDRRLVLEMQVLMNGLSTDMTKVLGLLTNAIESNCCEDDIELAMRALSAVFEQMKGISLLLKTIDETRASVVAQALADAMEQVKETADDCTGE